MDNVFSLLEDLLYISVGIAIKEILFTFIDSTRKASLFFNLNKELNSPSSEKLIYEKSNKLIYFINNNTDYVITKGMVNKYYQRDGINLHTPKEKMIHKDIILTHDISLSQTYSEDYYLNNLNIRQTSKCEMFNLPSSYIMNENYYTIPFWKRLFYNKSLVIKNKDSIFLFGEILPKKLNPGYIDTFINKWFNSEAVFNDSLSKAFPQNLNVKPYYIFFDNSNINTSSYFKDSCIQISNWLFNINLNQTLIHGSILLLLGSLFTYQSIRIYNKYIKRFSMIKQRENLICSKCNKRQTNTFCSDCNNMSSYCNMCLLLNSRNNIETICIYCQGRKFLIINN